MLMKPLVDTAKALNVRAEYDMRVQTLIVDADGRVVGLLAKQYGKDVAVRARKGVVLATGSFAYNNEMLESFAPRDGQPARRLDRGARRPRDPQAQALGADLAHMDAAEVAFFCDPQLFIRGILVNGRGQRYINEDTYPGRVGQATLYENHNEAYLIIDEAAYEEGMTRPTSSPQLRHQPKWVAETVEELEAEMGLPAGALQATVDVFNRHAENGEDPLFGKKTEWVKPIGSPVAAIDLRGMTGASHSAACAPTPTPRCCTSPVNRSPACSLPAAAPPASAPGATRRAPRSATAASSVVAPASAPPRPDAFPIRIGPGRRIRADRARFCSGQRSGRLHRVVSARAIRVTR